MQSFAQATRPAVIELRWRLGPVAARVVTLAVVYVAVALTVLLIVGMDFGSSVGVQPQPAPGPVR